jgi:hypothetical protein
MDLVGDLDFEWHVRGDQRTDGVSVFKQMLDGVAAGFAGEVMTVPGAGERAWRAA